MRPIQRSPSSSHRTTTRWSSAATPSAACRGASCAPTRRFASAAWVREVKGGAVPPDRGRPARSHGHPESCRSFAHIDPLGARLSRAAPGSDNPKEERLWRAALLADECFPAHPIKTFTNSERSEGSRATPVAFCAAGVGPLRFAQDDKWGRRGHLMWTARIPKRSYAHMNALSRSAQGCARST